MTEEEARSKLSEPTSYASVRDLPDGGIGISATPRKTSLWPLAAFLLIAGPATFFLGLWLTLQKPPLQGPMSDAPEKLLVIGGIAAALGPAVLLIRLVTGPPRPVELEVRAGEIKADRSIAGDRVRSTYAANDVFCLFTESTTLIIETRKGQSQLIAFGSAEVNQSIAFMLARHFWASPHVLVTRKKKPFMSHMPERVVFSSLGNTIVPN